MNFRKHVKDRIGYTAVFFINALLIILIMNLTLIINEKRVSKENIFYSFLISSALYLLFMTYDYIKIKPFYSYLRKAADSEGDLNSILSIAEVRTQEQLMYSKILKESYKSYTDNMKRTRNNIFISSISGCIR